MIYHVLPGDSLVETFEKTNMTGEIIVCRECLIDGDLLAENLEEFWQIRENYLSNNIQKDNGFYRDHVRSEFEKLLNITSGDEVNLWFEYELFCQANLWFCLRLISGKKANIYRVSPVVRNKNEKWKGFGGLNAGELEKCFAQRIKLSIEDLRFGKLLWKDFSAGDYESLRQRSFENREAFPYLKEVCEAAAEIETRPKEKVREIIAKGEADFAKVFQKFGQTEGVYGFGDLQVNKIYDELISGN